MFPAPEPAAPLLAADGVTLEFKGVRALHGVSFSVRSGELFSIIGPNGAGKTSLLNCVSGRYQPTKGTIDFDGQRISGRGPASRAQLGIARTFQNLALFAHMSVIDNIKVGRHHLMTRSFLAGGLYWLTGARDEEHEHHAAVEEVIDFLEIQHIRHRQAGTLPYGLRKRVELARAVAARPRLLLLDEPTSALDPVMTGEVLDVIRELAESGQHIVLATHEISFAKLVADWVVFLADGRVVESSAATEFFSQPQSKLAKQYLEGLSKYR